MTYPKELSLIKPILKTIENYEIDEKTKSKLETRLIKSILLSISDNQSLVTAFIRLLTNLKNFSGFVAVSELAANSALLRSAIDEALQAKYNHSLLDKLDFLIDTLPNKDDWRRGAAESVLFMLLQQHEDDFCDRDYEYLSEVFLKRGLYSDRFAAFCVNSGIELDPKYLEKISASQQIMYYCGIGDMEAAKRVEKKAFYCPPSIDEPPTAQDGRSYNEASDKYPFKYYSENRNP